MSTNPHSPKHAPNNPWHDSPHFHSIWQFSPSSQLTHLEDNNCRDRTRKQSGATHWDEVSSPMFDWMQQDGFYALLMGAISHQQQMIWGFAFVNDTDLCMMHALNSMDQVIKQMQQSVNHWEGLLWATGSALVPEKCFWHLVDFA